MNAFDWHTEKINHTSFRLRYLPGGTFLMGSEEKENVWRREDPVHPVQLSPFAIGEFPVTQEIWKVVMEGENPSRFIGDRRPVERVSWMDIVGDEENKEPAFLHRLNELTKESRPQGWVYRLPTEAEWEYAARAGTEYLYAGSDKLKEVGWFDTNSHGETKDVGQKRPNDWGLYDMCGNVWEWCQDWSSQDYYETCLEEGTVIDPAGPPTGRSRVLRGGAWYGTPRDCRVTFRLIYRPSRRGSYVGFRLVLAPQ